MALFSSDTKKKTKKASPSEVKTVDTGALSGVLSAPWFSEKALILNEKGVYVFQVPASSTKTQVLDAIETFYNVRPLKVRMVNLPAKTKSLRTRRGIGTRARRHKAYVYMKKGDTLSLV
jgi:ribosomal protein L23